jgi:tellurite methyltransferase
VTVRTIVGWHRDEEGDWVAELSCGHAQHVRHRPPFFDRPWVLTIEGRTARVGTPIDCPHCDPD